MSDYLPTDPTQLLMAGGPMASALPRVGPTPSSAPSPAPEEFSKLLNELEIPAAGGPLPPPPSAPGLQQRPAPGAPLHDPATTGPARTTGEHLAAGLAETGGKRLPPGGPGLPPAAATPAALTAATDTLVAAAPGLPGSVGSEVPEGIVGNQSGSQRGDESQDPQRGKTAAGGSSLAVQTGITATTNAALTINSAVNQAANPAMDIAATRADGVVQGLAGPPAPGPELAAAWRAAGFGKRSATASTEAAGLTTTIPAGLPPGLPASFSSPPQGPDALPPPLELPRGAEGLDPWSRQLGSQLLVLAGKGTTTAQLRLNPESLGPLQVTIELSEGEAQLRFSSPHAVTREALEAALPRLRELFADQGLQLVRAEVGSEMGEPAGRQQAGGQPGQQPGQAAGAERPSPALREAADRLLSRLVPAPGPARLLDVWA